MSKLSTIKNNLVDAKECALVVIDIQDSFLEKYEEKISQSLVEKVAWLLIVAKSLDIPVIAMAEDIENSGSLNQTIQDALPNNTTIHDKNSLNEVKQTGRKIAVLVGMETDVCVAQSALGLITQGFQVVVLKDAVATTAGDDEIGLNRMSGAGALISSVKAISYEWLRTASNTDEHFNNNLAIEKLQPSCLEL